MVHQPVYGRGGGHWILEYLVPFVEDKIAGDDQASAFIALGKEREEDFHFFPALLNITDIIQDNDVKALEFVQQGRDLQVPFGYK